jgi:hypothetical protein
MVIVKLSKRRHKNKIKRNKTKRHRNKTKRHRKKTKGGAPRGRSPSPPPPQESSQSSSFWSYFNPAGQVQELALPSDQSQESSLSSESPELDLVLVSMDDKIKGIVDGLNSLQTLDQQNYPVQLILGDIIEPDEALQVIVPFFDSLIDQYGLTHEQGNGIRNDIQQWIVDKTSEVDRNIDALNMAYDDDVIILNNRHDTNINSLKSRSRGHVVDHMQRLLHKVERLYGPDGRY